MGEIEACVVDDHLAVREGLPLLLERAGVRVVAKAPARSDRVDKLLAGGPPPVSLVGAGGAGLEMARRLAVRSRVVMLTDAPGGLLPVAALGAGAAGIVWKGEGLDVCVQAIRAVARGELWIDGDLPASDARVEPLSPRERRVLQEIAHGRSTEQVASVLHVSPHTVRTHLRNIQRKLQARTRAHSVAIGIAIGAIQPAA